MIETVKTKWARKQRAKRIAIRVANPNDETSQGFHGWLAGWRQWTEGMAMLKSILAEEKGKLAEIASAQHRMDEVKRYV